ncbi:hypothetical protein [Chroococcidiopsis sp. CCALA 051]|nr:hypothetical protein [Chroococcidiopsis sp. CCALA 051]
MTSVIISSSSHRRPIVVLSSSYRRPIVTSPPPVSLFKPKRG